MATMKLNDHEQFHVTQLEEMKRRKADGDWTVSDHAIEVQQEQVNRALHNAETRERMQAQRQAEIDAMAASSEAKRQARIQEAQAEYKKVAQATFPGTPQQFEAAWPELLRAWQIRSTAPDMDELVRRKRLSSGMY